MREMLVMVPSRNRPENVARLCDALSKTDSNVDLIVGIDDDDSYIDEYETLSAKWGDPFCLRVGPRKRFGPMLNELGMPRVNDYKYFMFCGDDHVPTTLHWDLEYRQVLRDIGSGVVYGNDLVMGEAIATQCAWTTDIVKTLGYVVPDGFTHLYIDNYFMEIARGINKLVYLPDVIVQHLHPAAGTAQEDQTYREANSPENWTNDKIRFEKYKAEELDLDIQKLKRMMNNG